MEKKNNAIPPCFTEKNQTTERLTELFVGVAQARRIKNGQTPAERAVFRKLHGVAHARLEIDETLPKHLKVGVFAQNNLKAWVRFSSDTVPASADLKTTLGIGIKLFGVPGPNALGESGDTADFIMQNHPVFFVDNAEEMVAFTYAGVVANDYPGYLKAHPETQAILDAMAKVEGSVLTARYWAILPFEAGKAGKGGKDVQYVKYRLEPETPPENVPNNEADYLATDLARRLAHREYRFRFMVQVRTPQPADPAKQTMPLDRATVEWPESESPFVQVGTLVLPQQDVGARGQAEYGQGLAFNIWRVPEAQKPVGSLAEARKVAYAASARARHEANGQPLQDPAAPREAAPATPPLDTCIVKAVIYPSIGVARVGTSDDWFVGPEVPYPPAEKPGFYRDAKQRLKRQAARFRVYGVNAKGEIVEELHAGNADIEWKVQLANTKAAWYGFQLALDIPEAASAPPTTLRNPGVPDRAALAITPAARKLAGRKGAAVQRFDDGAFMGKPVYLGELRADDQGHLIVLGGHGVSASYDGSRAVTFGNNEGWHDDVSDGPVTATVTYKKQPLLVTPAWVVVAPPNYGPQRKSVRTMWDLMRDVAIQSAMLPMPARPSFTHDILPIFERLNGLQWVNAGFAAGFGWKGMVDLTSEDALSRLSSASGAFVELRRTIALQFRNVAIDGASPKPWPWLYGDAMAVPAANTPRQNSTLSATQLAMLQAWAEGNFAEDYDPKHRHPARLEDYPLAKRGDVLTQAALDFCLADAFHPGCEMTWPVRYASMYVAPFRFAHAKAGWQAPNLGEVLTGDALTLPNGPMAGQQAGGLTRWMAVPWQTDTASCRSGYDKTYDPYVPSFWPARVPNQVLTKENYDVVIDEKRPLGERLAAFANRAAWIDPLGSTSYTQQINNMIAHFDHLGVVEVRDGPSDRAHFPAFIEVEDQHVPIQDVSLTGARAGAEPKAGGKGKLKAAPAAAAAAAEASGHVIGAEAQVGAAAYASADSVDLMTIEKVRRFPHGLLG